MTFNNLFFIFLFLPLVWIVYVILLKLFKNTFLVLVSLLFYAWLNPISLLLLLISICWDYVCGLQFEKNRSKINLIIAIGFHLFILAIYKYLPHFGVALSMPIGLSFFTFSAISYLVDVYTSKCEIQKNWIDLALYISFFGKVSMGPIVQYKDLEPVLKNRKINIDQMMEGIRFFIRGLAKKVILADRLSIVFSGLSGNQTMLGSWLVALSYMLQIYFDFSGYSDMAIGVSKCFGFNFDENFNHPYIATSVQDFWRRWHISLSRWFRDYVYIPLGGSRVSMPFYIRNIFIVWLCTGIWHGATFNFIVWGLYFGILLVFERLFLKDLLEMCPSFVQHIYTLLIVLMSWIFFYSPTMSSALSSIVHLFGVGTKGILDTDVLYYLSTSYLYILFGILFSMPIVDKLENGFYRMKMKGAFILTILYGLVFLICVSFLIQSTFQSFLYFAF